MGPRTRYMKARSTLVVLLALLGLLGASGVAAQEPVGRDSAVVRIPPEAVRSDTLADRRPAPRDSVVADSLLPAPNFPSSPDTLPAANGLGVIWEWTEEDLRRFHGLSIVGLLERVPGLVVTRAGSFGAPAGISAYASGGGRLRVFLDGWELHPLTSGTFDLQQLPLVDLRSVRVARELAEVRVELTTFRLDDRRAFAQVEAGDGDLNTRLLRALFARPLGRRQVIQLTYDLAETDGFRRQEPFNITTLAARWSYAFAPDRGVQLEYRNSAIDRGTTNAPAFRESADRGDLILRARGRATDALWLDAQLGRSWYRPQGADSLRPDIGALQAGARATYRLPIGSVAGTARLHRPDDGSFAAGVAELAARADLAPLRGISGTAEVRSRTVGGVAGLEVEGGGRVGPWAGVSIFGSAAAGTRGVRFEADSARVRSTFGGTIGLPGAPATLTDSVIGYGTAASSLAAVRAGADWTHRGIRVSAAVLRHQLSAVAPYGLAADVGAPVVDGGAATGAEVYLSTPLLLQGLRLDGWYLRFADVGGRPYLPSEEGRAALQFSRVFREGNFEPTARLELIGRGSALSYPAGSERLTPVDRYLYSNFLLQLRIIDVRAFFIAENLFNNAAADYPGRTLPGLRTMYGFRWHFRN